MRTIICLLLFIASSKIFAAGWTTSDVSFVNVAFGNGCIVLENGQTIKVDLSTDIGRAEFSLGIAALSAEKSLKVYQTDGILMGGCNTGTTIKPHAIVSLVK